MLVGNNSFDLWQRDSFFSAAEEVQESADILESAYRTWVSVKREGMSSNDLDELRRELQTALGTAKWQLEEFERAVRSSYGNCRDQNKMARHQQFVAAIESQIIRVEDALRESLTEEGKEPFRWVNLDEDERDDLAMFLSGSSATSMKSSSDETENHSNKSVRENTYKKDDLDYNACSSSGSLGSNMRTKGLAPSRDDIVINIERSDCVMELNSMECVGTKGDVNCESDRTRSTKRPSGSLRIVVPSEDTRTKALMPAIADTPKEKGFKLSTLLHVRRISCINKLMRFSSGPNNRVYSAVRLQLSSSVRLIIILMVSFFLLVPYLLQ